MKELRSENVHFEEFKEIAIKIVQVLVDNAPKEQTEKTALIHLAALEHVKNYILDASGIQIYSATPVDKNCGEPDCEHCRLQ